ncbi:glycine cleavage system protein H [Flavobacterium sp. JAS]|uniref:glycine cleavage system protein H n=1 Tax=Flavobacterium sp. JAS TaxID=2897329 RepID=UPI001E5360AA|nr:glycine cleavage system protein H [Flavobacterium sp. JAS]MCD0469206.1 glycine cleavage system protein H [Flavobacterium sp. JAS]
MFIPKSLYYTENHLWLRQIGLWDFYIGITDYAQHKIGKIELIELEFKNITMQKDITFGIIHGINQKLNFIAPLDCEILVINPVLQENISLINKNSYEHWFLRVRINIHRDNFLSNLEYKHLIKNDF